MDGWIDSKFVQSGSNYIGVVGHGEQGLSDFLSDFRLNEILKWSPIPVSPLFLKLRVHDAVMCMFYTPIFEPVDLILKHQRSDEGKALSIATCTLREICHARFKSCWLTYICQWCWPLSKLPFFLLGWQLNWVDCWAHRSDQKLWPRKSLDPCW